MHENNVREGHNKESTEITHQHGSDGSWHNDVDINSVKTKGAKPESFPSSFDWNDSGKESQAENRDTQSTNDLKKRIVGFFLGCIESVVMTISVACVQGLEGAVPDFELATIRGISILILISPVYIVKRKLPRVARILWGWLFLYSILGAAYHISQYIAVTFIPLSVAGCIFRTVLMLSVTVMARLFLKEKLTVVKVIAVTVSIVGTFLVIQPEGVFNDSETENNLKVTNESRTNSEGEGSNAQAIYGYLLACLAGLIVASITIIQKSRLKEVPATDLNLYQAIAKTGVPLAAFFIFEEFIFPRDPVLVILVIGQGFTAAVTNVFMKIATHMTTAILYSLATSLQIMFLVVAQYTVLKDIKPA